MHILQPMNDVFMFSRTKVIVIYIFRDDPELSNMGTRASVANNIGGSGGTYPR